MLRARRRLEQFQDRLTAGVAAAPGGPDAGSLPIYREDLAPCHPAARRKGLWSNFSESGYLEAVRRAIKFRYSGDVFQVEPGPRLLARRDDDSVALYLRLRKRNPAPFAGYFDLGEFQIASASPERFLRVADGQVETRPIKGTRPRTSRPEADLLAGDELLADEKRAET